MMSMTQIFIATKYGKIPKLFYFTKIYLSQQFDIPSVPHWKFLVAPT